MKKLFLLLICLIGLCTSAWATFPTTGVLYSGNTNYCTGVTVTTTVGTAYTFTITAGKTASAGATYTNNGHTFTVLVAINAGTTTLYASGTGVPSSSGSLVYASGTGTGPIAFSSKTSTSTGILTGTMVGTGTNCVQDSTLYVEGGTNGTFTVASATGGVVSILTLASPGTGYTAGSAQVTFQPLNPSLFNQYNSNALTVLNNQIVGTGAASGASWTPSTFTSPEVWTQVSKISATNGNDVLLYDNFNFSAIQGYYVAYDKQTSNDNLYMTKQNGGSQPVLGSSWNFAGAHLVQGDSFGMSSIAGTETEYYRHADKFTVTSANATQGAIYQDGNGVNYTVATTIASGTNLTVLGLSTLSTYSGTLTKQSGTGDSTITFTAFTAGTWTAPETASDSTYTSGSIGILQTSANTGIVNFGGGQTVTVNDFVELTNAVWTGQNSDGRFMPGGTFNLTATVQAINGTATTVTGTLASSDSCVTINAATETFSASLSANSTASNATPFSFSISSSCPPTGTETVAHTINLTMTLAATTGSGFTGQPITIPIMVGIPSAPVIAPPYNCITNYYVSMYGQDGDTGKSNGHAWLTMTNALNTLYNQSATQPGVCVNAEAGTYTILGGPYFPGNYIYGLGGVAYGSTPNSSQYFVVRSIVPHLATEIPDVTTELPLQNAAGFVFDNANGVVVDGFNFPGINSNAGSLDSGVSVNSYLSTVPGSYITMINNLSHDHGQVGLSCVHTDYCVIEGNITNNNAVTSYVFQGSGISEYESVAANTNSGYHNIVMSNIVFGNYTGGTTANHTDGNGIIIDDFQNTQNVIYPVYAQKTLVENNLIWGNGGGGVHVYLSNLVTVLNNTAYSDYLDLYNAGTSPVKAEFNVNGGNNDTFINNIGYGTPWINASTGQNTGCADVNFSGSNTGNTWSNNICYAGQGNASTFLLSTNAVINSSTSNILGVDPKFIGASTFNFNLSSGSLAKGFGTNVYGFPATDIAGNTITAGNVPIGAYQFLSSNQVNSDIK